MNNSNLDIVSNFSENIHVKKDVCIIGTGAGGCALANELAKNDKEVVMLEKGDYYDTEYIKRQSETELENLWKNKGIFLSTDFSINISQGQCVGGSTMINYGICFEIPEAVFSYWKSAFGIKISQDEMKNAYARVGDLISRR